MHSWKEALTGRRADCPATETYPAAGCSQVRVSNSLRHALAHRMAQVSAASALTAAHSTLPLGVPHARCQIS
jgi:hypothetical protein